MVAANGKPGAMGRGGIATGATGKPGAVGPGTGRNKRNQPGQGCPPLAYANGQGPGGNGNNMGPAKGTARGQGRVICPYGFALG